MDYNPLNQLLVCMVCGELQYSHSLDGVRAHIDEVHPHTLTLEHRERLRILEAWDEQVSKRERFFTSQLQQQGGALTGTPPSDRHVSGIILDLHTINWIIIGLNLILFIWNKFE